MVALTSSSKKLKEWWDKTAQLLIKRGKKCIRKLKDKQPKPSPWMIIKLLA